MLYGHLPFWGETEDEFIDKIINQPLKFDAEVAITSECKDLLKGMLQKDPERRLLLIDVMNLNYYIIDDEDLEDKVKKAHQEIEEMK